MSSKAFHCQICGTKYPEGWNFDKSVDMASMTEEIESLKKEIQKLEDRNR